MQLNNISLIPSNKCLGCMSCVEACPINCIRNEDSNTKIGLYPIVNSESCIHCGKCMKACPINTKKRLSSSYRRKLAIAYNSNKEELVKASSGGIFPAIAEYCLNKGFLVYGASIDDNGSVGHIRIDKIDDLWKICGTKYVQSDIRNCYQEIGEELSNGEKVLFSGTPCQVAAIKNNLLLSHELKIINENVVFVDLICHGVGQAWMWKHYLDELKQDGIVNNINFRNKATGWKNSSFSYSLNGKEKLLKGNNSFYMKAYSENLCTRASCFECDYKGIDRISDLTLGDAWGYKDIDGVAQNGLSFIIVQSTKMEAIVKSLTESHRIIVDYDCDYKDILETNKCIYSSAKPNEKSNEFEELLDNRISFSKAVEKVCYVPMYSRMINSLVYRINRKKGQ